MLTWVLIEQAFLKDCWSMEPTYLGPQTSLGGFNIHAGGTEKFRREIRLSLEHAIQVHTRLVALKCGLLEYFNHQLYTCATINQLC